MSSIKSKVIKGIGWSFGQQFLRQFINIAIGVLLARLLEPRDFGLIGMVTIFTFFAQVLVDFGLGAALVQRQKLTDQLVSTVFFMNFALSVIIYIILYISAPFIADFYGNVELIDITRVMSLKFIIAGVTVVQKSVLTKYFKFKNLALVNTVALIVSSVVALIMVYLGYGVWALVCKGLLDSLISSVIYWSYSEIRIKLLFSMRECKQVYNFGKYVVLNSTLDYLVKNADSFIVGKVLGDVSLGIYNRAFSLMILPVRNVSRIVNKVIYPTFCEFQEDNERLANIYVKTCRVIALVVFPMMLWVSVNAHELVLFLYGQKWAEMIPVIRVISILGALQTILVLNKSIYNSKGEVALGMRVNLIFSLFLIVCLLFGVYIGKLQGLVNAYLLVNVIGFLPLLYFATRLIKLNLITLIGGLKKILFVSILVAGINYLFLKNINGDFASFFYLVASLLVNGILYLGILKLFKERALSDVFNLIKNKRIA